MNEEQLRHNKIAAKLDQLERMRPYVILGFIIFWILLGTATIFAFFYYFG